MYLYLVSETGIVILIAVLDRCFILRQYSHGRYKPQKMYAITHDKAIRAECVKQTNSAPNFGSYISNESRDRGFATMRDLDRWLLYNDVASMLT